MFDRNKMISPPQRLVGESTPSTSGSGSLGSPQRRARARERRLWHQPRAGSGLLSPARGGVKAGRQLWSGAHAVGLAGAAARAGAAAAAFAGAFAGAVSSFRSSFCCRLLRLGDPGGRRSPRPRTDAEGAGRAVRRQAEVGGGDGSPSSAWARSPPPPPPFPAVNGRPEAANPAQTARACASASRALRRPGIDSRCPRRAGPGSGIAGRPVGREVGWGPAPRRRSRPAGWAWHRCGAAPAWRAAGSGPPARSSPSPPPLPGWPAGDSDADAARGDEAPTEEGRGGGGGVSRRG